MSNPSFPSIAKLISIKTITTVFVLFFIVACSSSDDDAPAVTTPAVTTPEVVTPEVVTLPTPSQDPTEVNVTALLSAQSSTFSSTEFTDALTDNSTTDQEKLDYMLEYLSNATATENFTNVDFSSTPNDPDYAELLTFFALDSSLNVIVNASRQEAKTTAEKTIFVFARDDIVGNRDLNTRLVDFVLADALANEIAIVTAGYMGDDSVNSDPTVDCGAAAADICVWAPSEADLEATAAQYEGSSTEGHLHALGVAKHGSIFVGLLGDFMKNVYSLSNTEIRTRIFQTADDSNCDRVVCGHGVVDYVAALTPVGNLFLPAGANVGDFSVFSNQYQLFSNNQLISPLANALDGMTVAMLDELNAPFFVELNDVLNVEQQFTNSKIYAQGRTYGMNAIDYNQLWDGKDASFSKISKKFNASNRLVMHMDSSLTASNSLRAYEANCLAACLLSDEFDAYLTGDMVQVNFGDQDNSYSVASCVSTTGNDCLMVSNAIDLDSVVLKSNILSTDELHDSASGKHQWMGFSVDTSTASPNANAWGNSNTDIASFGIDVPLNNKITGFYQMQMVSSQWDNPHQYAWLSAGSINYDTHKFGVEMNGDSSHTRLQLQTVDAQAADNYLLLNVPVGRTTTRQVVYDQTTLGLDVEQAHKLSVLYHTNVVNSDKLRTVLSVSADKYISTVGNQLSDDEKVKMAVSIAW